MSKVPLLLGFSLLTLYFSKYKYCIYCGSAVPYHNEGRVHDPGFLPRQIDGLHEAPEAFQLPCWLVKLSLRPGNFVVRS